MLGVFLAAPIGVLAESLASGVTTNGNVYQYFIFTCEQKECLTQILQALQNNTLATNSTIVVTDSPQDSNETEAILTAENSNSDISDNNDVGQSIIEENQEIISTQANENLPNEEILPIDATDSENSNNANVDNLDSESILTYPIDTIKISEIYPCPKTGEKEWLEIYNASDKSIDLTNWKVLENGGKETVLAGNLNVGEYLLIEKSSLNNDGDSLTLLDPAGKLIDAISYGAFSNELNHLSEAPKSGESVILSGENYFVSQQPTPGAANFLLTTIVETETKIETETETVENADVQVKAVPVAENETQVVVSALESAAKNDIDSQESAVDNFSNSIKINEIFPAPSNGEQEWLEIFNYGESQVNLKNWTLDDQEGGSSPYVIADNLFIEPQGFVIFEQADTKLSFNNSGDEARLFDPNKNLLSSTIFSKAPSDQSWQYQNSTWGFSKTPTKGLPNEPAVLPAISNKNSYNFVSTAEVVFSPKKIDSQKSTAKAVKVATVKATQKSKIYFQPIELADFSKQKKGENVQINAPLLVEPNVFSAKSAYLDGVELYFGKDFNLLWQKGEVYSWRGQVSDTTAGKRLLLREVSDLKQVVDVEPKKILAKDFSMDLKNNLVQVQGKFLDKLNGEYYFVDNNVEFVVKLNKNISEAKFETNSEYKISGFLFFKNNKFSVNPRDLDDLSVLNTPSQEKPVNFAINEPLKKNYWSLVAVFVLPMVLVAVFYFYKLKWLSKN